MIGASQSTVADYEMGDSEPGIVVFIRLAKALNVRPEWLTYGRGGFSDASAAFGEIDVPDLDQEDEEFASVHVLLARRLDEEGFKPDPRLVSILASQIWRDANLDVTGDPRADIWERLVEMRITELIEQRERAIKRR